MLESYPQSSIYIGMTYHNSVDNFVIILLSKYISICPICNDSKDAECQTPVVPYGYRIERKETEMMKPSTFAGTYAEWYQTIEKPRLDAITPEVRAINAYSHSYAFDGDSERCIYCEVAPHNGWKHLCNS